MRATMPSAQKPVKRVTAGVQSSILNFLQDKAEKQPLLALAVVAAAVAFIASAVYVIAAGFVVGQCLAALWMGAVRIARMVPVRAIWQKTGAAAAAVILWAMTHKKQLAIAYLVLNAPGIILELLKLIK